jgi:hypothetical protein
MDLFGQIHRTETRSLQWSDTSLPERNHGSSGVRSMEHLRLTAMIGLPCANECFLRPVGITVVSSVKKAGMSVDRGRLAIGAQNS